MKEIIAMVLYKDAAGWFEFDMIGPFADKAEARAWVERTIGCVGENDVWNIFTSKPDSPENWLAEISPEEYEARGDWRKAP